MAVSFMGLILVALVLGGGLYLIIRGFSLPRLGHATLACPHCGKDTKLFDGRCQHCRRDL